MRHAAQAGLKLTTSWVLVVMNHPARPADSWGTAWHTVLVLFQFPRHLFQSWHIYGCIMYICIYYIREIISQHHLPLILLCYGNTSICDLWFGIWGPSLCTPKSYILRTYHFLEQWWVAFSKEHTEVQDLWDVKEEVIVEDFSKCRRRNEVILRESTERMEAEGADTAIANS